MSNTVKRLLCAGVVLLFALGLCRAARFKFQDKEESFRKQAREQLAGLGLSRDAAKAKYPTPEIGMVTAACMMPGETGEVVVKGKFAPNTQFIFQNDNLEVVKENLSAGEYRATLKAAPGVGPQTAGVVVITPVTGITARHDGAAVIGGRYEWNLNVSNGWKVTAQTPAGKACPSDSAGQLYNMQFFKGGEGAPFEKREATLYYSAWDSENYSFSVAESTASIGGMADMAGLMQKMSDPKLTGAQRDALMAQIEKAQEQLTASMTKMSDPANIARMQQQQAEFGCQHLWLAADGGNVKGRMQCADKLGRLTLTGTMKFLGR
jgi:hypothetical protein